MRSRTAYVGLFVLGCAFITGCQRIERGKQVRAQGQLQYLSAKIEAKRDEGGSLLTAEEFRAAFDSSRLEDPWGRTFLYERFAAPSGERYVIASMGADGILDVAELAVYLSASREDVAYTPERDIVVVDGEFIRSAGK